MHPRPLPSSDVAARAQQGVQQPSIREPRQLHHRIIKSCMVLWCSGALGYTEPHRATRRIHCSADPVSLTGKSMVSWRFGVDNLPAYDRHHDACAKNVGFWNGHDVIRKDGEVGDFADLDAAALVLLKRRVRRPARKHLQCPGPRHALLQVPILIGIAVDGAPGDGDRKSTRLNSSHVEISYAVFCLKKKI